MRKLTLFTLVVMACSAAALAGGTGPHGWNAVAEDDGIQGFTRPTAGLAVDEIMAKGTVAAPVAVLESLLRDIPAQTEYMYLCVQACEVDLPDKADDPDVIYAYNLTDLPWPVKDRDGVARMRFGYDRISGVLGVQAEGIPSDFRLTEDVVRVPLAQGSYHLRPLDEENTEVTYRMLVDPGGTLPGSLVNLLSKRLGIRTIAGLRRMVRQERYQSATEVITTSPLPKPPEGP